MFGFLKFIGTVADSVDINPNVLRHAGRVVYGVGQATVGLVTESDELIEKGIKNAGRGGASLGLGAVVKNVFGQDVESDDSPELDV